MCSVIGGARFPWPSSRGSATSFDSFRSGIRESRPMLRACLMYRFAHRLSPLALSCLLASVSGCAATVDGITGFVSKPFETSTEEMLNIKTPEDRAKELAELAKTAGKRKRYDQDRISAELAEE